MHRLRRSSDSEDNTSLYAIKLFGASDKRFFFFSSGNLAGVRDDVSRRDDTSILTSFP